MIKIYRSFSSMYDYKISQIINIILYALIFYFVIIQCIKIKYKCNFEINYLIHC